MCETNSFKIEIIYRNVRTSKRTWRSYLVADDPPTHLIVLLTTSSVVESLTASTGGSSPTHPVWSGDLPPHRGTLLSGIRHVEVGYTSPAS